MTGRGGPKLGAGCLIRSPSTVRMGEQPGSRIPPLETGATVPGVFSSAGPFRLPIPNVPLINSDPMSRADFFLLVPPLRGSAVPGLRDPGLEIRPRLQSPNGAAPTNASANEERFQEPNRARRGSTRGQVPGTNRDRAWRTESGRGLLDSVAVGRQNGGTARGSITSA